MFLIEFFLLNLNISWLELKSNLIVKKLIKKSLKLKYDNLEVKPDLSHEALNNSTYLYGSKGWIVGV